MNPIEITPFTPADLDSAYHLFKRSIPDTFEKEGLTAAFTDEIQQEVDGKKQMLHDAIVDEASVRFLVARMDGNVIGAISIGPCKEDVIRCTEGKLSNILELGSLYVMPEYQGQGIGSALIHEMITSLAERGIEHFCLDSGYRNAQMRWLRKFGKPYVTVQDYWGPDLPHMVWHCNVADYLR
ncbi:GNAT family N-acetyltransferase [Paenibacillus glycanilyticus]|uniref:N-acetyltransferase n=1 Tax=Paenibacillus glycanilyticus TaxID=126569 RepID=A0ABQ6G8M6_9BACL|nr:N-acetyltransferase [Paenibacillus glycanilyticus]